MATFKMDSQLWRSVLSTNAGDPMNDVVYLLALEGDAPNPSWTFWHRALDFMVQTFQPAPVMTHTELLVPPLPARGEPRVHFSTYSCKTAGWEDHFEQPPSVPGEGMRFYLGGTNATSWRAIPVMGSELAAAVREEATKHQETPYSLKSYFFSAPPGRALAWTQSDDTKSPCHCATLSARVLRKASPSLDLPCSSAWYAPSTLFIELGRKSRVEGMKAELEDRMHTRSLPEQEAMERAMRILHGGSDDSVRKLAHEDCSHAILVLTKKAIDAADGGDATERRLAERTLARALLRWSQLQHFGNSMSPYSSMECDTKLDGAFRQSLLGK